MKATFRIVTPAAATAAAALLLTACADKPVRIPGGAFVDEPYQGETETRPGTIPSNGTDTMETEVIYIDDDVPVGPVEDKGSKGGSSAQQGGTTAQQGGSSAVQSGDGPQVQPVEQPGAGSGAPEGSVEYRVVADDTLWSIGMVFGVSVDRLAEVNGIDKNAIIKPGQIIMIPPDAKNAVGKPVPKKNTQTSSSASASASGSASSSKASEAKDGENIYVVKKGDTLSEIAERCHVKTADLAAANKIKLNDIIRPGQTLIIPASGKAAASTAKPSTASSGTTASAPSTKTETAAATTTPKSASGTQKTAPSTKTEPAAGATTPKSGESSGGVVGPIGGASSPRPAASQTATGASSGSASSRAPETGTISIPIEFDATIEEVAAIHERNLQELMRLNPSFKPGQIIPVGTIIKLPVY